MPDGETHFRFLDLSSLIYEGRSNGIKVEGPFSLETSGLTGPETLLLFSYPYCFSCLPTPNPQIQEPQKANSITEDQTEGRAGSLLFPWSILTG